MSGILRDPAFDNTITVVREGNTFITSRCQRYNTDVFLTRILLKKTFCIRGEQAAKIFYTQGKLTRVGAMPGSVLRLLQDKGSVATLNDEAHHHRKKMFMALMTPQSIAQLMDLVDQHWHLTFSSYITGSNILFFDAVQEIIFKAVCEWSGIALKDVDVRQRTKEIAAMIDGAGAVNYRNLRGTVLRWSCESWLRGLIEDIRASKFQASANSAINVISLHKDIFGNLLDTPTAAVELLNIIRPTVAVARFVLFAALALHQYPQQKQKLNEEHDRRCFVQEVRRFYPFFPFVGGIVRENFMWQGHYFNKGARVLLDVYGTNHDERIWKAPYEFNPERFINFKTDSFNFIPQGGGDFFLGHRCAGEHLTIALIERSVNMLVNHMQYDVEPQDYSIDLTRMPALPKHDFIIKNLHML